jgi:prolyl 4-hydroxylase
MASDGSVIVLDDRWKSWIRHNVDRGCSKDGIFRILLDEGFAYDAIRDEMDYAPSIEIALVENPLRPRVERASPAAGPVARVEPPHVHVSGAVRLDSPLAELYTLDNVLTEAECEYVIAAIGGHLWPSTITNPDEPDKYFRTSRTCDVKSLDDPFTREVDERLCRIMSIDPLWSENLQAHRYDVGQQFKPHIDYFEGRDMVRYGADQGQRTWTLMVYLNVPRRGGETRFPVLGLVFAPRTGTALIWNNLTADGRPNPNTLHEGAPVLEGYKAILTKWFRAYPRRGA